MAKYIVQHRRGTAEQWASNDTVIPREGELVIEIDEDNSLHRLKIGDGVHTYAELAYLVAGDEIVTQVLTQALPRVVTVTLDVDQWVETTCETDPSLSYYAQTLTLDNVTTQSRLDLQPDADMLAEFKELDLVFVTENNGGVITVHSVGDVPLKSYTMQATIIETELKVNSEKVVGTPVGTPTISYDVATTDTDGLLSASDKEKLDGIEEGANKTIVDSELSDTSTNPLQNKVVTEKINSANSTITSINSALDTKVTREVAVVGSDDENSAGWYKVADGTVYPNTDVSMLFAVHSTEGTKSAGILQLNLRSTSSTTTCQQFGWLVRNGFNPNNLIIATDGRSWAMYFKVLSTQYYRTFFEVIQKSSTNSSTLAGGYALYTNSVVETAEPTATYTSTDLGVIKTINENLDKKVNLTNGTIQGAVDWNTITKTGCYKIQNCTMTADYNAPVDEYKYGVLQVLNSENETGEYRVTQIYIPHRHMLKYGIHIRSNNSATGYNDWTDWVGFYNAKQLDAIYKNQNAFSNIVVGSTTIAADSTTDSLTLAGSNVTLTPDATNDKVTISVADGTTSTKGVVQLINSTSSTSTTTAATPNSVKTAYDLANTVNTKVNNDLKNHTSFLARRVTANTVYINLGKFTGDNSGGKAIITISGNPYWGGKSDGGFRVLTLSSNSYSDISSTDIHTGASLYDFGLSNYAGTEIIDDPYNIQVALVRPNGYSVAEVDVYLKFNNYQYNSYLVTVDYSDGCSWVTSTEKVTTSDPDPMENALSAFIVPKKTIGDNKELKTPKEKAGSTSHTAPYCQSELAIDDFTKLNDYRTIIGTISGTNDWNNIISVRHRNGAGDGSNYGMYLRSKLTGKSNLIWRQQTSAGWEPEKTLLDNSNYASYIPQATTSKDGLLSASDKSKLNTDLKNHTSFHFISATDYVEYIKLGKFTGDGNGGRAIFTINGKQGWNNKNDGGLKILTLSSNYCSDSKSDDIHAGGTFYIFGHSDDTASSVIEGITTDIVLVRARGYSTKEVDVYIKTNPTKYTSYFVTVDYSVGCSWTTSTQEIISSETSPTERAVSYFTVPKKHIADSSNLQELKTPKESVTSNSYTAPYCQSGIIADSLTELNKYRTTIGTATVSGEWNNIISVRHRNGGIAGDGQSYGMYLRAPMTYESNLMWRQQSGASWKAEKTLLDSSNFTNYIPYETGTWTPLLNGVSSNNFSNAKYYRCGKQVTVTFTGSGYTLGGKPGVVSLGGLPFVAASNFQGIASFRYDGSTIHCNCYEIGAGSSYGSLFLISTNKTEYFTITYFTT